MDSWLRILIHAEGFATKPHILSVASRTTMTTATTATTPAGGAPGYAKGWAVNATSNWWHLGDIAGTASEILRTNGEFGWAALFNSRDDANVNAMRTDIDALFWTIASRITDWPSFDLF